MINGHLLAIDIGGTFTDLVLLDPSADALVASKVLTTYPDPSAGVLAGVQDLFEEWQVEAGSVGRTVHGTTLITNALIERKGSRTGLITTAGFRDALEIGREGRYDIYDLFLERPAPLVERRRRREVPERVDASGAVLTPLDEEAVRQACAFFRAEGVEAVAIVFLHGYLNSAHEQRAQALVRRQLPDVAVAVSHQVAPEFREYERTSTTVANAYVQPLAARYLKGLEEGLGASGVRAPLHIMLSNGGSCSVDTAAEFPVRLVESGPCGGALAAAYWGKIAGRREVLAFDMGGTTAKAILTAGGDFSLASESEVARVYRFKKGSGLPLLVPVMDMIEIGAGGGSIARLSDMGLPVVGPESAGADPGPACYGRGGTRPTVTDADLVLGLLNADYFPRWEHGPRPGGLAAGRGGFGSGPGYEYRARGLGYPPVGGREYGQCRPRTRGRARPRHPLAHAGGNRGCWARARLWPGAAAGSRRSHRAPGGWRGIGLWFDAGTDFVRLCAHVRGCVSKTSTSMRWAICCALSKRKAAALSRPRG